MNKKTILEWYCENCHYVIHCKSEDKIPQCEKYGRLFELSALLDKMIESAPTIKEDEFNQSATGYNRHCDEVSDWKAKMKEG